jgi:hypothetical protein
MTRGHLIALLLLGGCAGDNVVGTTIDPNASSPPSQGLQLTIGPFNVPAGGEVQLCRTMKLPNIATILVNRITTKSSQGSYQTDLFVSEKAYEDQVFSCWGVLPPDWQLAASAAHSGGSDWILPDAAFVLQPHQQVMLRSHYVNASTIRTPNGGMVWMNLYTTTDPTLVSAHATALINTNILIPPRDSFTTSKICTVSSPIDVFALSGHFNMRGTHFTVDHLDPDGKELNSGPLYQSDIWDTWLLTAVSGDGPHGQRFSPGDGLRFTCSYYNETEQQIGFGGHADVQERCDLDVYYSRPDEPLGSGVFDPRSMCAEGSGGW